MTTDLLERPVSQSERARSDQGSRRIREYILNAIAEGAFRPGDKLPTERELMTQFGVTRSTARKALVSLEAEGHVTRHVGRGTFVANKEGADASGPSALIPELNASPAEYVEARLRLEPHLADLVVTNATASDFERMESCVEKSEKAATLEEFELWDARLHQAIAAATHNSLLIRMYDMIHAVRHHRAIWGKLRERGLTPERRQTSEQEHREILEALKDRDAERARAAITTHIRNTRRRLLDY